VHSLVATELRFQFSSVQFSCAVVYMPERCACAGAVQPVLPVAPARTRFKRGAADVTADDRDDEDVDGNNTTDGGGGCDGELTVRGGVDDESEDNSDDDGDNNNQSFSSDDRSNSTDSRLTGSTDNGAAFDSQTQRVLRQAVQRV